MNTRRAGSDLLPFHDRSSAGQHLANMVTRISPTQPLVLALPRGGVPVATQVARALHAPLDILLVRKIGTPMQPELALAAVVEGTPPVIELDEALFDISSIPRSWLNKAIEAQLREIDRRRQVYLAGRPRVDVHGHTVIVVDDGIATGTCMRAAIKALRQQGAKRIMVAVPVAPPQQLQLLRKLVDDVACLATPAAFDAIGSFYEDFHQLSDDEVSAELARAQNEWMASQMML